jgi:cellulose 1,4-beta-cellobiosidase
VNPSLRDNFERTMASASPQEEAALKQMMSMPSAFWIDNKAKIRGRNGPYTLEGILQDASSRPTPPLCVFIFYDLPNRDCNAKASNGEISDAASGAAHALQEYKREYVDAFVDVLVENSAVPTVLIIEPDSLGNVISNAGSNGCSAQVVANYKEGVAYAVTTIAARAPHVGIYVDAAHGGWMGFEHNAQAFVELMNSMNIIQHIRGFSANVANYQTLGVGSACPAEAFALAGKLVHGATRGVAQWCQDLRNKAVTTPLTPEQKACCEADPCHLMNIGSGGATELSYVQTLRQHFIQSTGWAPTFVIDTGRNGALQDQRSSCSSWCNTRGAGAGHAPTMNTGLPGIVDAFFWLKTPGESDGCTRILPSGQQCARFDSSCESMDSIGGPTGTGEPHAPEAGGWFEYQVKMLARNANMRVAAPGALNSMWGVAGSAALDLAAAMRAGPTAHTPLPVDSQPAAMALLTPPARNSNLPTVVTRDTPDEDDDALSHPQVPVYAAERAQKEPDQSPQPEHAITVVTRGGENEKSDYDFEFPTFDPPTPPEGLILGGTAAPEETSANGHGKTLMLGVGTWAVLGLAVLCARKFRGREDRDPSREERKRRKHEQTWKTRSSSSARGAPLRHPQESEGLVADDEEGMQ